MASKRPTGTTPGSTEARFPGFDVLSAQRSWDGVTRGVVLARLAPPSPLSFFTREQEPTARELVDRLLAQDDDPKVPVLEVVDRRLANGEGDGFRYADMPQDGEAWSRSIEGLDADARVATGQPFWDLDESRQMDVIERVRTADGEWHGMPAGRVFQLWMRYTCEAFYAHPWAWNEIGFPGPAYPHGYKNLGLDRREGIEVAERDAADPVPWAERAEAARAAHAGKLGEES